MGDGDSNGATGDTLKLLEAEREDMEKALECVRQLARGFDTLTERRKSADAGRVALCLKLRGPDLRRCVWKGFTTPEAFQWYRRLLGKRLWENKCCRILPSTARHWSAGRKNWRSRAAVLGWLTASSSVPSYRRKCGRIFVSRSLFDPRPDESRSQNNSAGNPGVLIYTNDWDTYIRYTKLKAYTDSWRTLVSPM